MENIEYIKNNLSKNPTIMKALLKMEDIHDVDQKIIVHFHKIVQTKRIHQANLKISYNDYNSFKDFYYSLIKWLNIAPIDIGFHSLNLKEKEATLMAYDIRYYNENGILVIFPTKFEETCIVGSPKWCIVRSKNLWASYNKNKKHMVIVRGDDVYGMSFDTKSFKCFNKNDLPVPYVLLHTKFRFIINEYTRLYKPTSLYLTPCLVTFGFLISYISTKFMIEAQLISSDNQPFLIIAIGFLNFLYYKSKAYDGNLALAIAGLVFCVFSWITPEITKDRLHSLYQFEHTLLDQELITQEKQQAISDGNWLAFKNFESDDNELMAVLVNSIENGNNESFKKALKDEDIIELFTDFSSTYKTPIYRQLILNNDFESLKQIYDLSTRKEYYNNFIIYRLIENNSRNLCLKILQEKLIDPSTDNNSLLRWATFNESTDIVLELLKFDSVTEKIDQEWLDRFIVKQDILLDNILHLL